MKKLILIFTVILTCQFLTGQMTDNVDPWFTDNDTFGSETDTVNVYVTNWDMPNNDTIPVILLISACIECPTYTTRGYCIIGTKLELGPEEFMYEQEYKTYLDEFKQEFPERVTVWDYKEYKWENK